MSNFRLRYENVEQENRSETGKATSLRSLIGWQAGAFRDFSVGVQIIDVTKLQDDDDDHDLSLPQGKPWAPMQLLGECHVFKSE